MENGWDLFNITSNNNHNNRIGKSHDHNNNTDSTTTAAAINTPQIIYRNSSNPPQKQSSFFNLDTTTTATAVVTSSEENSAAHALMSLSPFPSCLYGRGGEGIGGPHSQSCYPDPHLMCLKLGKRHYFGDAAAPLSADHRPAAGGFSITTKRGKPYYDDSAAAAGLLVGPSSSSSGGVTVAVAGRAAEVVPRCQVDGCHAALVNAREYHRRHKVCEQHSKAPKVVVLGSEQRFCQQCSRFHAVGEFDESKRSCRRRLAGHNERRRKSSSQDPSSPRPNQTPVNGKLVTCNGKHPYYPLAGGYALSLLSSKNDSSWISSPDLPARCSAALRELIAENRAAILSRQLIADKEWYWHRQPSEDSNTARNNGSNALFNDLQLMASGSRSWDQINEAGEHVTLDLMQAPSSAFGLLSMRGGMEGRWRMP